MSDTPGVTQSARREDTRIPWVRVIGEGLVIVVSILLAFGIDASWQNRAERRAEQRALSGLMSDFLVLEQGLIFGRDFSRSQSATIDAFLDSPGPTLEATSADSTSVTVYRALTITFTFEPAEATLDGLIASGNMDLLSDADLRRMLNEWRHQLDEIQDGEAAMRLYDLQTMVPYLAREFASYRGPASARREPQGARLVELAENGEFQTLALTKAGWMRATAEQYDEALILVREIRSRLESSRVEGS